MKSYFVTAAVAVSVAFLALSLVQAAITGEERLAWLAAAVAHLPLPLFIARLHRGGIARTSENLPFLLFVSAAGFIVAVWESFIEVSAGWLPSAVATIGLALLLLYVFWYSRYGRFPNARLAVGSKLPEFEAADLDGKAVHSSELVGRPAIVVFYHGNWCTLCIAQLRELAERHADLERMGVTVNVISPQPEQKTRKLVNDLNVSMRFLTDPENRAAESLGISEPGGVPARSKHEYRADTVMPTVIATNASGTILYSDETDNYRVRPEPDIYISILRRTGAVTT